MEPNKCSELKWLKLDEIAESNEVINSLKDPILDPLNGINYGEF